MSAFRFNFSGDTHNALGETNSDRNPSSEEVEWIESEEVFMEKQNHLDEIATHANMFVCRHVQIGHIAAKDAILRMGDNGLRNVINLAEENHSDLIRAKYEGGLKIWECTYDLMEYFIDNDVGFKHLKVLDMGCGAGILGIHALLCGAEVVFQDYNKEVLEYVTINNVLLNSEEVYDTDDQILKRCKFYSGDWESFNEILSNSILFDIIVTSETIYNTDNYQKIISLFVQRLKKNGIAYVAAKTCYFGVGGGTREFEKCINNHPFLESKVCWKSSSGGIQREILKITRNQSLLMVD